MPVGQWAPHSSNGCTILFSLKMHSLVHCNHLLNYSIEVLLLPYTTQHLYNVSLGSPLSDPAAIAVLLLSRKVEEP